MMQVKILLPSTVFLDQVAKKLAKQLIKYVKH